MPVTLTRRTLIRLLGTPRLWFGVGLVALAVGMVLAYHDVQVAADHVIATRDTAATGVVTVPARPEPGAVADLRRIAYSVGVVCFIGALLLTASPLLPRRRRRAPEPQPPRPVSRHRSFAPIVSQDEIAEAEAEALVRSILPSSIVRLLERPGRDDDDVASFRSRR